MQNRPANNVILRLADLLVVSVLAWSAWVMAGTASVYPPLNPDESGAFLGLRLLAGSYGFSIDPGGSGSGNARFFTVYPPVYYLLNALTFAVSGFGIVQARVVTIILMLGACAVAYAVASRRAGLIAGIFLVAAFFHLVPVRLYPWVVNRPDIAANFFIFLALVLLSPGSGSSSPSRFALAGATYALAVLSHFVALMAAPVIAAVVLWRTGGKALADRRPWAAALGSLAVLAVYAAAAGGDLWEVINNLTTYTPTATEAIAPWRLHLSTLYQEFPHLLGLLGGMAILACCGFSHVARTAVSPVAVYFAWAGLALAFAVSFYPNIGLLWFYGLSYVYASILAISLAVGSIGGRYRRAGPLLLLGCLAALGDRLWIFHAANLGNRDSSLGLPVSAAFDWISSLPETHGRVIGPHTLVFSHIQGRLLAAGRLINRDGVIDFPEGTHGAPRAEQFQAVILDQFKNVSDVDAILTANRRWHAGTTASPDKTSAAATLLAQREFRKVGEILDPGHITGNLTVHARLREGFPVSEPAYAMVTTVGAVALNAPSGCARTIGVDTALNALDGGELWGLRISVPWLSGVPPALRLRLKWAEAPLISMVMYYGREGVAEARQSEMLRTARYGLDLGSAEEKAVLANYRLPDGSVGTDMLLGRPPSGKGTVAIYGITPGRISEIEISLLVPDRQACGALEKSLVDGVASAIFSQLGRRADQ